MKGTVFDVQRFSIHDGPGIRTTVFLKGCTLRCLWCHNPESQKREPELGFFSHKCTMCGACKKVCEKAFERGCVRCGKCAEVCPTGARELFGKERSGEEVFSVIKRDKEYYLTSGGGVTVSGGEPLLQADFCAEILRLCKEAGIHTAVETAGNVPWENFLKVLPFCDLFLYDVKVMDEDKHRELTGSDNKLILANAEKLRALKKDILFRTPVVPGYNDDQMDKIAAFCGKNHELLAYHEIGKSKYQALGREYTVVTRPPSMEEMKSLAERVGAIYSPSGV